MQTFLDCIPCFVRLTLESARRAAPGEDELHRQILNKVCLMIPTIAPEVPPPIIAEHIHTIIREETGNIDPYKKIKALHIKKAGELLHKLEDYVSSQDDPMQAAIRVAISGNIMDLGANPNFNLDLEIQRLHEHNDLNSEQLSIFRESLERASQILYIGDNTGEAIFDKVLIKRLSQKEVFFATRSHPIMDDITLENANLIGLNKVATIIESGSTAPGTVLEQITDDFRRLFYHTPLVLAKGQGNFETLSDCGREIFFLFKVKCQVVSQQTGMPIGSSVILRSPGGEPGVS